MFLVDSHCHLGLLDVAANGDTVASVVQRARDNGVGYFLNVAVSVKEFPSLLSTSLLYDDVSTSVGLHPNDQDEEVTADELIHLANHPKVIAIGETGLDYFRSTGDLMWQRDRFRAHVLAAKKVHKPLIVHTRDAKEDTLIIMREENAGEVSGVMHCFTEDWMTAKAALDLGFYISFSGIVTFKNASTIQEVAKKMPLDRMLIETDSPYLAPSPHRGKANEPAYVRHTAEFIATLRGMDFTDFAVHTTDNFFRLFTGAKRPHV
jgi:TatD DNase family protein